MECANVVEDLHEAESNLSFRWFSRLGPQQLLQLRRDSHAHRQHLPGVGGRALLLAGRLLRALLQQQFLFRRQQEAARLQEEEEVPLLREEKAISRAKVRDKAKKLRMG